MKVFMHIQGQRRTWAVEWDATKSQVDAMRDDGIEVNIIENIIPAWIVNAGLTKPWCFFQDVWNLRNPFRH